MGRLAGDEPIIMRPAGLLVLLLMALLLPSGGAASADASKPLAARAIFSPEGAIIVWAPGTVLPDHYVVYGVAGNTMSKVATASSDATEVIVDTFYSEYAIVAVMSDGTTSAATYATALSLPCILISVTPPEVSIGCNAGVSTGSDSEYVVVTGVPFTHSEGHASY